MTNTNRPARLNRTLLALIGVVLLAAGGLALVVHFGLLPALPSENPLVPGTAAPPNWAWYAIAAGGVVVGLLVLRWLAAQLARTPPSRTWRLERDPDLGRTELPTTAAVAPFLAELREYPGVHDAHATLTGSERDPALVLVVGAEQDGDLTAIRERIATEGLPRLCQALDLPAVPTTIEFRFSARSGARVH